jgi:hypothetical protein
MAMPIVYVGIDLAKHVFALHGVDEGGRAALVRPSTRRHQLMEVVANLPPSTIGMDACSSTKFTAGKVMSGRTKRCANRVAQTLRLAASALRTTRSALDAYFRRLCAARTSPSR